MTLCAEEIGVPAGDDGDHQSGEQLAAAGVPLVLARRAAEEIRMARAAADLEKRGEAVTSQALAEAAHISREHRMHLAPRARNGRA